MKDVIWKYELRPWTIFLDIPQGAKLLAVGAQGSDVVAWFRCNPDARRVPRMVAAFPTGVELPLAARAGEYVGTVQMDDGLIFHVFEGEAVERDGVTTLASVAMHEEHS